MKIAESILEYTASNKSTKRTSVNEGHFHHYRVDLAGNGMTTFTSENTDNHIHEIKDSQVMSANGHTHTIGIAENVFQEAPTFKTTYGFEHWWNKIESAKKDKLYSGSIVVAGKRYKSLDDAVNALIRRQ